MAEKVADSAPRPYNSPLRERQTAQTREAILHALADEILDHGIHGLSVADVAARAAVAERTVYRHFANVEAMLEALSAMVTSKLDGLLKGQPRLHKDRNDPLDNMIDALPRLYAALDQIGAPARALAAVTLARGADRGRRERQDLLREALATDMAHLDPGEARAIVETLHMLGGSVSWFFLTRSGELTGEQAGQAAARIARAVVADLRAEKRATPR